MTDEQVKKAEERLAAAKPKARPKSKAPGKAKNAAAAVVVVDGPEE